MSTETLQITKENALKAYKEGCPDVKTVLSNLFGKEHFVPLKITDRIKTLDDVFAACKTERDVFYRKCESASLTKDEIAYRLLKMIAAILNEGWIPDWDNSNERKWRPWFYLNTPGFRLDGVAYGGSGAGAGARLHFKTEELCKHSVDCFLEVYKDYFTF